MEKNSEGVSLIVLTSSSLFYSVKLHIAKWRQYSIASSAFLWNWLLQDGRTRVTRRRNVEGKCRLLRKSFGKLKHIARSRQWSITAHKSGDGRNNHAGWLLSTTRAYPKDLKNLEKWSSVGLLAFKRNTTDMSHRKFLQASVLPRLEKTGQDLDTSASSH